MVKAMLMATLLAASGMALASEGPLEFGGTGGLGGFLLLQPTGLESFLTAAGFPSFPERALLRGGYGIGGEAPGPGVGGMWLSFAVEARTGERGVQLELGYGALLLEQALPLGKRVLAGLGLGAGRGEARLTLQFRKVSDLGDALATPAETRLQAPFWGLIPYLRLEGAPTDWFTVEGWLGYFFSFPWPWRATGNGLGASSRFSGPLAAIGFSLGGIW